MLSSAFIAETTEGMATAINQSGSLRMQSYRIGVALADESIPAPTQAANATALAEEFEVRLNSPRLVDAIDGQTNNELTRTYARITQLWQQSMSPPLSAHIRLLAGDTAPGTQAMPHGTLLVTTRPRSEQKSPCWDQGCRACLDLEQPQSFSIALDQGLSRRVKSFPVQDRDQRFGVLLIDLPADGDLEPWQQRLLAALAGHIGTALNLQQRVRESRRLVLHEERSIIARELHDSLAQSLSYLKIQVTRLSAALNDPNDRRAPNLVLGELREGINSAYRQLRERTLSLEGEISTKSPPEGGLGSASDFRTALPAARIRRATSGLEQCIERSRPHFRNHHRRSPVVPKGCRRPHRHGACAAPGG